MFEHLPGDARVVMAATSLDMLVDMGYEIDEDIIEQTAELWAIEGDDADKFALFGLLCTLTERELP